MPGVDGMWPGEPGPAIWTSSCIWSESNFHGSKDLAETGRIGSGMALTDQ